MGAEPHLKWADRASEARPPSQAEPPREAAIRGDVQPQTAPSAIGGFDSPPGLPLPRLTEMRILRGPDVLKRMARMYRAAFPDLRITVDDVIAADDKVVLRWHSEGTHRGELAGLAPTGAHGSVTGISIDRWKDGKVIEAWAEWDNLGLARQLGAAPPEGSVGEKIGMGLQRLTARWTRRSNAEPARLRRGVT